MWPWYQEALKNAFEDIGLEACGFGWFNSFWKREENNKIKHKSFYHKVQYRLLAGPTVFKINLDLIKNVESYKPDIIFLYTTTLIFNSTLKKIKRLNNKIKLCQYNNDSPFSEKATKGLWRLYKSNIPLCDYHFIFRESDRRFYSDYGAKSIHLLMPYYIPEKDYKIPINKIPKNFISDITFAGHYEDDGRLELLENLISMGYNLKLYGGGWNKVIIKKNSILKKLLPIRPVTGIEYNYAICGSKIALCFLSKINSDTYTRRNFEVPAMGKLMLSEYSQDLEIIFKENEEMVFFRNRDDFFNKIDLLLENHLKRKGIEKNLEKFFKKGHSISDRARFVIKILDI